MFKIAVAKEVDSHEQGLAFFSAIKERLRLAFVPIIVINETIQKKVARGIYDASAPSVTGMEVFFELAKISGFTLEALRNHRIKHRPISRARAVITYILYFRYGLSTRVIGELLNYSTHCGALFCLGHFDRGLEIQESTEIEDYYVFVERRYQSDKAWKARRESAKRHRTGANKSTDQTSDTEAKTIT